MLSANLYALQEYKNVLNTLLEETISLDPLTAAIQEFTTAAHETDEEIKVTLFAILQQKLR